MRFVVLSLILLSCRHDSGEATGINLSPYQHQRDSICESFDASTITRCDRATFHVMMNAMCGKSLPTEYENPSGKWKRDTAECYATGESSSETSRDTYLSVLLSENKEAVSRIVTYAEPLDWETGEPTGGVGNITPLVPLLRGLSFANESDSVINDGIEAAEKALTGHRGHLVAGYLYELARQRGGLTTVGASLLRTLHSETPDSPYLSCLYHRFSGFDNDQSDTIKLLKNIGTQTFGWGSSVWQVHYAATVRCLEGL